MSCAHCPTQTRLLNRSRQGKQPSWSHASKAIATGDPRRNCAIASSFWLTMAWRPAQPCALRSRHCVSAVLRKLSWQYQLVPRTLAANSKTKLTRRFAQARRNSFRQSASITKIFPKPAMRKCASCSRVPRKNDPLGGQEQIALARRIPFEIKSKRRAGFEMNEVQIQAGQAALSGNLH